MIWYLGLFLSAVLSFFLALRSMRDFQENPDQKKNPYGLFLIRNKEHLSSELFTSLINALEGVIASLELIQKGSSIALVGYFPRPVQGKFPNLGLVEIEDYIAEEDISKTEEYLLSKQIQLNDSFAWLLQPKNKKKPELQKNNFELELEPDQYFCQQIVFQSAEEKLQITPRVMIKESNSQQKIDLIKKIKQEITEKTTLTNNPSLIHTKTFEDYKKRAIIPKQADSFLASQKDLLDFLIN